MTKYIGKRIIAAILLLLAAGFMLYMLAFRFPVEKGCILFPVDIGIMYDDEIYLYRSDTVKDYFSLQYFIPVKAAQFINNELLYLSSDVLENEFVGKYYISPFTRQHILYRDGAGGSRLLTLHSIESIS